MATPNQIRNVTLVGANGTVGAPILSALIDAKHKTTVLTRPGSKTDFPSVVTVHVDDYNNEDAMAAYLKGQDVLILALSFTAHDLQIPLIKAAARAGVPYIVPCEFGSDPTHAKMNADIQLMNMKAPYRKLIEDLGISSWVGVVNNPWVEFSMRRGFYGIDLKSKSAVFYDDGTTKANLTTLTRVGESLAALFTLPEVELSRYKNQFAYFSSFYVSQRDILASAMRATGTTEQDWTITSVSTDNAIRDARAASNDPMASAGLLFALVFKKDYGGDYDSKLVNHGKFALPEENLDLILKELAGELDA